MTKRKEVREARPKDAPVILVHGLPARDVNQVARYLGGDDHDRSKVQIVVGGRTYNLVDLVG